MRGAELLGCVVYDRDHRQVGHVHDLRFTATTTPASVLDAVPRYRLTALIVGPAAAGHRLGFGRGAMAGPWPFTWLFRRLAARSYLVAWTDIERLERPRIQLRSTISELIPLLNHPQEQP